MVQATEPARMMAPVRIARLEARGVTVRYGARAVLEDVSVRVEPGEVLYVMGPSGCGKTTLLKTLAGLIPATGGEVLFEGRRLERESGPVLDALRRTSGFVFQGSALLSSISLGENIALPMRARLALPRPVLDEAVRMKLAQVGLLEAAHLLPSELSGGMRKRAGIARALALDPSLLLFDEPTSGLDPITADEIDTLVGRIREDLGATVVVVSHDLASARKLADRVAIMAQGRALAQGTWAQVGTSTDERVRAFLDRRCHPIAQVRAARWEES
jgi:phospholipid/cholesterol/gamma-HCH transport system ATP-binding protein